MRDDRLIGLATFAVADARRVASAFADLPGVLFTALGRAGGREAVQIEFDPGRVSYAFLLEQLARMRDAGAAIFWHTREQAALAGGRFPVERAPLFYRSEETRPGELGQTLMDAITRRPAARRATRPAGAARRRTRLGRP